MVDTENYKSNEGVIWGYARCSTDATKQDIKRQTRELKVLGATDATIYYEYESGTKDDRVELNKLLNQVKQGDTIVATEVSRITRSTKQLIDILEFVKQKKIKLILGGFVVDCTNELDAMTEGMLKMMGVFAEMERNMISQRVKSGMENARSKGKVIGRPTLTEDDIPNIFLKHYPKYVQWLEDKNKGIAAKNRRGVNITELSRLCNMSITTIYKYIELLGDDVIDKILKIHTKLCNYADNYMLNEYVELRIVQEHDIIHMRALNRLTDKNINLEKEYSRLYSGFKKASSNIKKGKGYSYTITLNDNKTNT